MKHFIPTFAAAASLCLAHCTGRGQTATMTLQDPLTGSPTMTAVATPPPGQAASTVTIDPVTGLSVQAPGASVNIYGQSSGVTPPPRRPTTAGTPVSSAIATPPSAIDPVALKAWEYQAARPPQGRQNAERNLIIRSTEADAKTMAAIEEDLNVMARILAKAVRSSGDPEKPAEAMGVPLSLLPNSGAARNVQIEGYGAIFRLSVGFPLKGTVEKGEAKPAKEPTNSDWEQSKREIYGSPDARVYVKASPQPEYDSKRVDKLKDSLLEALKNASNMSHIKPDETITVVVTSGGKASAWASALRTNPDSPYLVAAAHDDRTDSVIQTTKDQNGKTLTRVVPVGSATETTMTLRANKSDIDAFGAGKLSLEQFRNKAAWLLY